MNTETVEAPMSNLFERRLMNGSFAVINRYLEEDARKLGVWNEYTIQLLEADFGSISKLDKLIEKLPHKYPLFNQDWNQLKNLQLKYKTMWELPMRLFLKLAADRGRYVDQSQSTNLYFSDPTDQMLKAVHITGYKYGAKTGMYYLRQLPATEPCKITVIPEILNLVDVQSTYQKKSQPKINHTSESHEDSSVDSISTNSKGLICTRDTECSSCQ